MNLHRRTGHRPLAVRRALTRAVGAVLRRRTNDGGFAYRSGEPYTYMGMHRTATPADSGQLFATWFALHTLALASPYVSEAQLPGDPWQFNRVVSMGWHDPQLRVAERPDPWVDRLPEAGSSARAALRHAIRMGTLRARRVLGRARRRLMPGRTR